MVTPEEIKRITKLIKEDIDGTAPGAGGTTRYSAAVRAVSEAGLRALPPDRTPPLSADGFEKIPFKSIIEYVYEYWGKSGLSASVAEALKDVGISLSPASTFPEVANAMLQNKELVLQTIREHPGEVEEILAAYPISADVESERYFVFDIIDGQLTLVFGPADDMDEVNTFLLGQYGTSDLAPAPHAGRVLYLGNTEVMVVPEGGIGDFFARME